MLSSLYGCQGALGIQPPQVPGGFEHMADTCQGKVGGDFHTPSDYTDVTQIHAKSTAHCLLPLTNPFAFTIDWSPTCKKSPLLSTLGRSTYFWPLFLAPRTKIAPYFTPPDLASHATSRARW